MHLIHTFYLIDSNKTGQIPKNKLLNVLKVIMKNAMI